MSTRLIAAVLTFALSTCVVADPPIAIDTIQRAEPISFEKEILPILQKNCLACHSASERQGGLILESPLTILKGGDSGPAVVAGKGLESLLIKVASHQLDPVMPPTDNDVAASNLTSQNLGLISLWIDQGARGTGGIESLSPKQMRTLPKGITAVQGITLTQDGQYVAFGRSNQILLYHVPTGQLVTELADPALASSTGGAHRDLVQSLTFNVDGDLLASGGFREARLWRRPRDVQKLNIALNAAAAAMAVSPDRKWIATNGPNNTIQLFNAADGAAGLTLTGHTDAVSSLRFTEDGLRLLSGSLDQTICIWNIADGSLVGRIETPTPVSAVEHVSLENPTEQIPLPAEWIVSGGGDNLLRVWQIPTAAPAKVAASPANLERTVSSRDGRLLAMIDNVGGVKIIAVDSATVPVTEKDVAAWKIEGGITSFAFVRKPGSPEPTADNLRDCYNVLAGTPDGTVQLWNLAEQTELDHWKVGSVPVRAVSASVDGTLAVSGSEDGATFVWNLNTAPTVPVEAATGEQFAFVALSPSRKQMATVGTKDGQPAIIIRSTETQKVTHTLTGHTGGILSLAFSKDDARLVSGGDDRILRVWDLRNAAQPELTKSEPLAAAITAVGSSDDGTQVLAGFADNALRLLNVADGMVLKEFAGHTAAVSATGFRNGQPYSVSADATVRFWNAADGAQARAITLPSPPTSFAISSDTQRMAFGGVDNQIRICQTDNGVVLQTLQGFATAAVSLGFSQDTQLLSVVNADGRVSVWNTMTGRVRESFIDPKVKAAAFATTSATLLVARQNEVITARTLRFLQHLDGNTQAVRGAEFHPNNQLVFVAAADGSLRGFSPQNGQATFTTSHGAAVNDLAVSMDGQVLATAGDNNVARLWNASGGAVGPQQLTGFPGPVHRVAFSTDGKQILAVASGEKPVAQLHDVQTGVLLQRFTGHAGVATGCSILPVTANADPRLTQSIALTGSPTGVYQWSIASLKQVPGHGGPITSLARIPQNPRQVFSGSTDSTIRRWNLDNGQQMQQYNHGGPVVAIAVAPDVQRIASASENHTAKLFNINGQQIAELRGDIRRRIAQRRAQQQDTATTARLNIAKQLADVAEKDLPVKTEAEKKLSEMLATANTDVETKKNAMETAFTEKTASEKAAIEASAAAKTAIAAKQTAEQAAKDAAAAVIVAQAKLARLTQASNSEPQNAALKEKVVLAQEESEAATLKSTEMAAAVKAPTDEAASMSNLANEAAKKLVEVQKPYNDAVAALKVSEAAQNLLAQQQVLAAKELTAAQELIPLRKEAVTRTEALLAEAKAAVEAANASLQESDLAIRSITFSPDGSTLATSGDFPSIHTWDATTGAAVGAFAGHTAPIRSIAFVDERTLVSASDDQSVRVWESNPDWILERTIGSQNDPNIIAHRVTSVDFSEDSLQLLVAGGIPSRRGELQVFNVADGSRTLFLPQAHDDVIYSARFSSDGKRIASGGADKYLRIFDIATSEQLRRFEGHTGHVLGVAWKRDGQVIASAAADDSVKIWDSETGDQRRTIQGFGRHVTAVNYIGETDIIISACGDKLVRMHNSTNGGLVRNFQGATTWIHAVAVTPDSAVAAAADAGGSVYLWNGTNGQLLKTLALPNP